MLNGMKIYVPQTSGGKFKAYYNQLVIIVAKEKTIGRVYLTKKVDELLGIPEYVHVGVRGNNLYIWKATNIDMRGYKVSQDTGRENTLRWINVSMALKENNIRPGVYRAVYDNDTISFDFYQTPSQI